MRSILRMGPTPTRKILEMNGLPFPVKTTARCRTRCRPAIRSPLRIGPGAPHRIPLPCGRQVQSKRAMRNILRIGPARSKILLLDSLRVPAKTRARDRKAFPQAMRNPLRIGPGATCTLLLQALARSTETVARDCSTCHAATEDRAPYSRRASNAACSRRRQSPRRSIGMLSGRWAQGIARATRRCRAARNVVPGSSRLT
jgi:hypothetical protein